MKTLFKFNACLLFIVVLTFLASSGCQKDEHVYDDRLIQQELQQLADETLIAYKEKVPDYPGGIALKVLFKDREYFVSSGMGQNISDKIHFRAASNTKTFTSAAILLLYQQRKLDVFGKITDTIPGTNITYIPDTPEYDIPFKENITILDLLHHRAGVFDISNAEVPDTVKGDLPYIGENYLGYIMKSEPNHTFTFDELLNVVSKTGIFLFEPGTSYHYTNTGYSILGKIIERVSKKSYQRFLMEDVISPMGLTSTTMPVSGTDQSIPEPFARGYLYDGKTNKDVTLSNISANVAEGNLITTPYELSHFLRRLLSGQGVLTHNTVNSIMMNWFPTSNLSSGGYGCGLTYSINLGFGHNGAHEGYLSQMAFDPSTGFTVVVFTNTWDVSDGMSSIGDQMYNILITACYGAKNIVTYGEDIEFP